MQAYRHFFVFFSFLGGEEWQIIEKLRNISKKSKKLLRMSKKSSNFVGDFDKNYYE
jgi:hypothetical protein